MIWCTGEILIDLVAGQMGVPLAQVETFYAAPGGAPANVAVGVARLGGRAGFIGKVGCDEFGRKLAAALAAAGVDTSCLHFAAKARTGLAFVAQSAQADRAFLFYREGCADTLLAPGEIDTSRFGPGQVLHFGSVSLARQPAAAATEFAARAMRAAGGLISYDPNLRPPLWDSAAAMIATARAALCWADVVKVSAEELAALSGTSDQLAGARQILALGPGLVLVTRGAEGALAVTNAAVAAHAGFSVAAVDTTGAGDGFVAGALVALSEPPLAGRQPAELQEAQLQSLLRFAAAVGALTVTAPGAIPALPRRAAVEDLLGA